MGIVDERRMPFQESATRFARDSCRVRRLGYKRRVMTRGKENVEKHQENK